MANLTFDVVALDRASATFLKMAEQVERLSAKVDKLDGKTARVTIDANDGDLDRKVKKSEVSIAALNGREATVHINAKVDKSFAEATVIAERFIGAIGSFSLPAGIAAATPAVVALAGAAVQMTGALGVVPAVGFAAAAAIGTVKIATSGFGDALKALSKGDMEAFNEQLGKMAPNAQAVLREYAGLQPAFQATKLDVQTAFWADMGQEVQQLGALYLPILRSSLVDYAWAANEAMLTTTGYLRSAEATSSVSIILDNNREAMSALVTVGRDIVAMLLDIGAVGSEFLPGLAGGFAEATAGAREWVAEARKTGELHDIISRGLSILGNLALALIDVGAIAANVFRAAGIDADGFTVQIAHITQVVRDWSGSMEGQAQIGQFFASLRDIATALLPILALVGITLVNSINSIAPTLPALTTGLVDVVTAATPLLSVFSSVAVVLLTILGPALTFLAPVLGPLVGIMAGAALATRAWAVATAVAGVAQKAFAVTMALVNGVTMTYNLIAAVVSGNLRLWATAQLLLNMAMAANPIGVVIVVVAALVAAVILAYNHSETFRAIVTAAWAGIQAAAAAAWSFLQGVFGAIPGVLASVGGFFTGLWTDYVVPAWSGIVGTVQGAWAAIQAAGSAAWAVLQTIFSGIGAAVQTVGAFFMGLYVDYVQPAFAGIADAGRILVAVIATVVLAPILIAIQLAQLAFNGLRDFAVAAFRTISEEATIWWGVLSAIWNTVTQFLIATLSPAFTAYRDLVVAVFTAISDVVVWWWGMVSSIWNLVIAFVSGVFTATFAAFRDVFLMIWRAIAEELQIWWDFAQSLWNAVLAFIAGPFTGGFTMFGQFLAALWLGLRNMLAEWWNANVMPLWNGIIAYLSGVFTGAYTTFTTTVSNLWAQLQQMLSAWWQWVLTNVWAPIVTYIIGPFVTGFNVMRDGATAAWNAMRDAINAGWMYIRDNVWNPLVNFITVTVPDGFRRGVSIITGVWDTIKAALRAPIQAVIDVVYNRGIVAAWNIVAGAVGLNDKKLNTFTLPGFYEGGPVTEGGRRRDDVLARLNHGEHVWTTDEVEHAGGHGVVSSLRQHATDGSLTETLRQMNKGTLVEGAEHTGMGTSRAGLGNVQPHVAQAANLLGPRFGISSIGGVGSRPNASDHPKGLALDFMTSGNNGTALANYVIANKGHFGVTYAIWRQAMNSGGGWRPMANRGGATANHMDHVHVSFGGPGNAGAVAGSVQAAPVFNPLAWIAENVGGLMTKAIDALPGGNQWADVGKGTAKTWVGWVQDWVVNAVSNWGGGMGGGGGIGGAAVSGGAVSASGPVQGQVQTIAAQRGWGSGPQWNALATIIGRESSWNPSAANPTSSARGLFQKMTSLNGPLEPTVAGQTAWGLNYIASRYGTPTNALAHHNRMGWYANGAVVDRPTFGVLGESGPEVVLPLRRPDRAANLAQQAGVGGGDFHVHVSAGATATAEDLIRTAMHQARLNRLSSRYSRGR